MARKAPAKLSPRLEDELRDKLEELLDQHDDVAEKRRRLSKLLGGHLKVLDETVGLVRRQLKGQDLDQLEIPGTEMPAPAQDPLVQDILRIAGGIIEQPKEAAGPGAEGDLRWLELEGTHRAEVDDGEYTILPGNGVELDWGANWVPSRGPSKILGRRMKLSDAKEACERHHLEHLADATLKNAGAGDLTRGDLKGPAEKFRKGR